MAFQILCAAILLSRIGYGAKKVRQMTFDLQAKTQWIQNIRAREIDPQCNHPLYEDFLRFAQVHVEDGHYLRNCQTLAALLNHSPDCINRSARILECGGLSLISKFLLKAGYKVSATSSDLRYDIDADDGSVDVLFSLEVVEHIKDQAETQLAEVVLFRGTGVTRYCSEMRRVCRAGGILLLTTPNPCSLRVLQNLVSGLPPMVFRPHVREYTKTELVEMLQGFALESYAAHYSFFNLGDNGKLLASQQFGALGAISEGRGDDHCMIFRRTRDLVQKEIS